MKKIFWGLGLLFILSCSDNDKNESSIDYAQEMRNFVINIHEDAIDKNSEFIIIPQNGIALVANNQEATGDLNQPYLEAIDGVGQEDLYFGFNLINEQTPVEETNNLNQFLQKIQAEGKQILVTDYCFSPEKVSLAYQKNMSQNYIPFVAPDRELNKIPLQQLPGENNENVTSLSQVQNFLYLLNTENFNSKADFIQQVQLTNYDLLITDLFFQAETEFSSAEIEQLKQKANGGKRLVIAYLSIGEAEDYRYYWKESWNRDFPDFIEAENPEWEGNFKVKYWEEEWQEIIYGNEEAYLSKIMNAGFQGVYLDIIDAYEYFE
ncbi:endo alpha-1,4 polygalactosaminidase [Mesonia maritima]|uniref:Cysteinyl-tRNA synthetase n=1 Tax=Mesonia maritima TaxID=1793873 RepID=A0ABU1K9H8_9FLAO|nr:endo alpha-1,4 polygalactosaminidase [Mesonia maritima]MDR6302246.1 cysteinyl-tRNA synthetase [Mesonia maritima]